MKRIIRNIVIVVTSLLLTGCLAGGVYLNGIFNGMYVESEDSTPAQTVIQTMDEEGNQTEITVITDTLTGDEAKYYDWDFGSNYINVLCLGVDAREVDGYGLTDVIIIASLDIEAKTIRLVSIMRDTYVKVSGYSGSTKINSVYAAYGGINTLMNTINDNFGTNLTKYAIVNFYSLATIIDRIGGVVINVDTEAERTSINGLQYEIYGNDLDGLMQTGLQTLTGKQAVAYARIRKVGNGDFERTERQREVMSAMYDSLKNCGILAWPGIFNDCKDLVKTNLTADEIMAAGVKLLSFKNASIEQLRVPMDGTWTYQTINNLSCVVVNFTECKKAIGLFLEGNYVPPEDQ